MNKIARLSALAVVLAASVGTTAFAATSTVTAWLRAERHAG